jgi:transposase
VASFDESLAEQLRPLRLTARTECLQQITEQSVQLAYVHQGYTGENAAQLAQRHGIRLEVVKHTEAKRGFVLRLRRWVVERSFAWATRFRRLNRDYERLSASMAGYHYFAFAWIMLAQLFKLLNRSS